MADESSLIGRQLGSYRIIAEINSGSYGSVYTGKHLIFEDDPMVAIKVLHAHLGSPREREQFIHEAQLLKKLKHPFILPILDASIQDGIAYIVTEYASRGSLRVRLNKQPNQPIPLEESLTILSQVGQALDHAHQQNIVHRDLKPANILFNARGEALLADFGIATALATAGTKELGQGGTPAYMAPEQFEGMVSMKSDQYALGCIAYELVTGRKPFHVENVFMEAVWYQHAKVNPIAPTQHNPHLPNSIEQAILKAMAKQRAERHPTISAFISALQKSSQQWFNEGNALYDLKRYEEALSAYDQAIRLNPNDALTYNNKGNALNSLKRYEEALSAYDQAIRLNPNDALAYNNKGAALNSLKRYEEALSAYDQAIRLNPNDALAYNNKGAALNSLKRYEEALSACDQAIRLNPNDAYAYNNKGAALNNLKRYEEALAAYDQAIRLNPNYAYAYTDKGAALNSLKRYEEALQAFEQAIRLDPNDALAYNNKGSALNSLKRYEEALQAFEQAIRLDPNYANAYYNKGIILDRLGKGKEAQQTRKKAQELGSKG